MKEQATNRDTGTVFCTDVGYVGKVGSEACFLLRTSFLCTDVVFGQKIGAPSPINLSHRLLYINYIFNHPPPPPPPPPLALRIPCWDALERFSWSILLPLFLIQIFKISPCELWYSMKKSHTVPILCIFVGCYPFFLIIPCTCMQCICQNGFVIPWNGFPS